MSNQYNEKENKMNPLVWFFFAIIVPLIVAITLAFIIIAVTGFDAWGWVKSTGKNIPVISSLIPADENEKREALEKEQTELVLKEKEQEIEDLLLENNDLKAQIKQMKQKQAKLEKSIETNLESRNLKEDDTNQVDQFVGAFKDMKAEQGAQIIENMNEESALSLLKKMPNKVRGKILEAMDSKKAAILTEKLIDFNE
ncbi:MAG TPA: hypothetical protein VIG73_09860 [Cerasibacillus sp.]|uniref:MotE family protein n=1 Tax=Cerasibacillus sp. TaxID=2498711 RepID=UPI002F42AC74